MARDRFHDIPFDEATLTKLDIFDKYTSEWLPVFLSRPAPKWRSIHIYDFFAGPGGDSVGESGSPVRILRNVLKCQRMHGFGFVQIHLHFFDKSVEKVEQLRGKVAGFGALPSNVTTDIRPLAFSEAFVEAGAVLRDRESAKLIFLDQYGVSDVTDAVFRDLVGAPTSDFLMFISSSTLHRFRDHHVIRQKISRPDDAYHVHRMALEYYRGLVPEGPRYYLAPFSIKKKSNVYGIIFGTGHPRGMDKFLTVAWRKDAIRGEANFDIDRENLSAAEPMFPALARTPKKLDAFEHEFEIAVRRGLVVDEADAIQVCFEHGVTRAHSGPVLKRLKNERVIDLDFRVPDIKKLKCPRRLRRSMP